MKKNHPGKGGQWLWGVHALLPGSVCRQNSIHTACVTGLLANDDKEERAPDEAWRLSLHPGPSFVPASPREPGTVWGPLGPGAEARPRHHALPYLLKTSGLNTAARTLGG
ncbi:hypothetical protein H920_02481 [Fukomys damarensis]|uniref:Uncharacterized protein n=1 Tax=Fukomys damarensis TaxID=885580 RepID=A0A091DYE6_FUKDA|nr:hypothetical protein H920_02481 [Fukomys damarensis]